MKKQKRKYTRRKKENKYFSMKKIFILGIGILFFHIFFINTSIINSSISKSDVLVIFGNNQQNSKNIEPNLQKIINTSAELFNSDYTQKILILGDENEWGIDEVDLIQSEVQNQDIWGGNIASIYSSVESHIIYMREYLEQNEWDSILIVSDFYEFQKIKNSYSYILGEENISIKPISSGITKNILGVFTNYYHWWKK